MKTKRLIIAILVLPFLMNCSLESNTKGDIALVEKYIKAVESLDYPTMESLLAENYMGFGPSYKDSINKVQALDSWKYNVENLYERIEYIRMQNAPVKINTGPNKGDWVSSWAELSISYKSKETLIIWANTVYKVENNKIVKSLTFYNEADAYQQLGYVFIDKNDL
ncbi:hypothetical protein N9164_16295 [Draconibacterium sp.]|nr:hypothetical protein [Draconibacterium sp.]